MRRFGPMNRHKVRNVFGGTFRNGLNFAKSVDSPYSRLARVISYLKNRHREGVSGTTKRDILIDVFRMTPTKEVDEFRLPHTNRLTSGKGWSSSFFSTAVKCGFLSRERRGTTVVWSLGPKHDIVKTR